MIIVKRCMNCVCGRHNHANTRSKKPKSKAARPSQRSEFTTINQTFQAQQACFSYANIVDSLRYGKLASYYTELLLAFDSLRSCSCSCSCDANEQPSQLAQQPEHTKTAKQEGIQRGDRSVSRQSSVLGIRV